ncbi:MAG: IS1/IS1595 family N-terminal zinc-binding domain-containing protein [Candidatus Kapaibacteriota bacterium]
MRHNDNITCIYCKSSKVIRHGKTSTGNRRYRCRNCGKTWVMEKAQTIRPDIVSLTEAYLSGRTFRDLVEIYKSSPLRINKKVREFLEGCPHWEEYLDLCVPKHNVQLIYLIGRTFAAATVENPKHTMYIAMAVDSLSNVILGFELSDKDDFKTWFQLLGRMRNRGVIPSTFMTNGSIHIEDAVNTIYPNSTVKLFYHRFYRDKEVQCCLTRAPMNIKLINDAIYAYEVCNNHNLSRYLKITNDKFFHEVLKSSPDYFCNRLRERLDNKPKIRIEGLSNAFQARFEKFHMLKSDPFPLVNGWIARWMLQPLDIGFSRLAIYMQLPVITSFRQFSCGQLPNLNILSVDSPRLKTFIVEIAARALQIPIFYNRCEMKLDKCSLY